MMCNKYDFLILYIAVPWHRTDLVPLTPDNERSQHYIILFFNIVFLFRGWKKIEQRKKRKVHGKKIH